MRLVLPRCRKGISHEDVKFLAQTLAVSGASYEAIVAMMDDPPMRDRLLDEEAVFSRLLNEPETLAVSPLLYFYVLVRHSLLHEGVEDRDLADYLASLLLANLTNETGGGEGALRHVPYVSDCMQAISASAGADRFFLIVELADRLLFLTGIFPAHLEFRSRRRGAPDLGFYENVGLAQYRVASDHALAREFCLEAIFRVLGEAFHETRIGLNRIVDALAFMGSDGGDDNRYLLN